MCLMWVFYRWNVDEFCFMKIMQKNRFYEERSKEGKECKKDVNQNGVFLDKEVRLWVRRDQGIERGL